METPIKKKKKYVLRNDRQCGTERRASFHKVLFSFSASSSSTYLSRSRLVKKRSEKRFLERLLVGFPSVEQLDPIVEAEENDDDRVANSPEIFHIKTE